jgi:hypothetical protein
MQGAGGATSLDPAHHPYAKVKKIKKKPANGEEEEEEHPYAKVERKRGNRGQEPEVRPMPFYKKKGKRCKLFTLLFSVRW